MARYFFNIRSGSELKLDEEGIEFDNVDLAIDEAVASAREIMAEKVRVGAPIDGDCFEITTEQGTVVHIVAFRNVLGL